jgi:hypothetical protein
VSGSSSTGPLTATTNYTLSCTGSGGTAQASAQVTVSSSGSPFPLRVEAGKRYLVTAQGTPFFMQGDTAWSMITQLTTSGFDTYLNDRQARGFNTVLVELIEAYYSDNAPNNIANVPPFTTPGDFSTPNEAYFAHAAAMIQKAADRGMVVLLTPAYMGYPGTQEGWYDHMQSSGNAKLYSYGVYLANRFAAYNNIIWVHGGDRDPPDPSLMRSIIDGIRSVNTTWLHTFHGLRGTSSLDFVGGGSGWLTLNSAYSTTDNVTSEVAAQYAASDMPILFIEAYYEGNSRSTNQTLRQQAYQSVLAGASGQVFGNNPLWFFRAGWQSSLATSGAASMQHFKNFWTSRNWWLLQPSGSLASSGNAALASDRSYAVVYTTGSTTVQLSLLAGPSVTARWFNPWTGAYVAIGQYPATGSQTFTTPGDNGTGTDWVLVLE